MSAMIPLILPVTMRSFWGDCPRIHQNKTFVKWSKNEEKLSPSNKNKSQIIWKLWTLWCPFLWASTTKWEKRMKVSFIVCSPRINIINLSLNLCLSYKKLHLWQSLCSQSNNQNSFLNISQTFYRICYSVSGPLVSH